MAQLKTTAADDIGRKILSNERGSALLMVLLVICLLTLIGISSTSSSETELRISTNTTLHKLNFYQAEAVLAEGLQLLEDADLESSLPPWVLLQDATLLTTGASGTERDDVFSDSDWASVTRYESPALENAEAIGAYRGVAKGNSLDVSAKRIHVYDVYGRSQQRGLSAVKVAFRKAY